MKKSNTITKLLIALCLAVVVCGCLVLAACKDTTPTSPTAIAMPDKTTATTGDVVSLNVAVNNTNSNYSVTIMTDQSGLVSANNTTKTLTVVGTVTEDTVVNGVVIVNFDDTSIASINAAFSFTVTPPATHGDKSISLSLDKVSLSGTEKATMTVTTEGLTDTTYRVQVSHVDLVEVNGNEISIKVDKVAIDTVVTITVISNEDNTVVDSKTILVMQTVETKNISVTINKETLSKDGTITFDVVTTGLTDPTYSVSFEAVQAGQSIDGIVSANGNTISVTNAPRVDTAITLVITSNEDSSLIARKTFVVKAYIPQSSVGDLTSEMIQTLGNQSITVYSTMTDVYTDFNASVNNSETKYRGTVKMQENRWSGSWFVDEDGFRDNVVLDVYRRGEDDNVYDDYGHVGHALERLYINKDNEVAADYIKNYRSVPSVWEAQHLWNHLGQLQASRFVFDTATGTYHYTLDPTDADDLYLMTYLSFSLTPLLEDTLNDLWFVVNDGEIVSIKAQTEVLYYGADANNDPDAMSYTYVEFTFTDIGTTVVDDPAPYDAPINADKLQAALTTMQNATNYTFRANDVTTYRPVSDDSDYELASIQPMSTSAANYTSSVGQVGLYGRVTEDAVLLARTGKYDSSMDGKNYWTEYSGYKQNADNTYDVFEYSSQDKALVGSSKQAGSLADVLPGFDFSPNIFAFAGTRQNANGQEYYDFTLRETSIVRDLAMEVSMYSYAQDGQAGSSALFTVTVDGEGNLISTKYPYSITQGTYLGYVTTTYSDVGTTALPEDTFDGYIPRVWPESWSETITKYYQATLDDPTHEENSATVLLASYGAEAVASIPAPSFFLALVGDNFYGPFFDLDKVGTDASGNPVTRPNWSITLVSNDYDENMQINNLDEIYQKSKEEMAKLGFVYSAANSNIDDAPNGTRTDRVWTFTNSYITIVFSNNYTRHIWVDFYPAGTWTLNKGV